ncbi:MAG: caspase family protein [Deltaproteobacteria bacterium]|nr:caspase family protein [Deltaproteobacteria bacterium]
MKRGKYYLSWLLSVFLVAWLASPVLAQDADCLLAKKIGKKAAETFKSDQEKGLQQFIQAQGLCPEDAVLNFNLGFAYFRYGNMMEAELYLTKAVSKEDTNAAWLNVAAWAMLKGGAHMDQALALAKKAAKLALDEPAIIDTLILACLANGEVYEAAAEAHKAKTTWPRNEQISSRYSEAIDEYIAVYLKKTKAGHHNEALAGLGRIDFDAQVANAYCWALQTAGKTEEALSEAHRAKEKFPKAAVLKDTFDQLMDTFIQACYQQFKVDKPSKAIMTVDAMKRKYPGNQELEAAYDQMMKVVLHEADTISVPEPKVMAGVGERAGRKSGSLIAELQGVGAAPGNDLSLEVDVDRDIPRGKERKPEAIAIIIGNADYSSHGHGIPDVAYAQRDAAYMKQYVKNVLGYAEENIILEKNVTQGDLVRLFGTSSSRGQLYNWVKPNQSDVFIYYAGHGAPDPKGEGAFLVPVDAHIDYIAANGYLLDTLYANLAKVPAKSITMVIDACFSGDSAAGKLVKNVSPGLLKSATPIKRLENAVVFTSTDKDQVSHWYTDKKHSLFTYFFMKGLKGEADKNGDKSINVAELKGYLLDKVPYRARRLTGREQTPLVTGDESRLLVRLP